MTRRAVSRTGKDFHLWSVLILSEFPVGPHFRVEQNVI